MIIRPRSQTRDLTGSGQAPAVTVTSLAALKALVNRPASVITQYRSTEGDGGGGTWVWRSGNQSANVTADTQSGLWAAPDSAPTGASGAWQRQYSGDLHFHWFGGVADGTTSAGVGTDNKDAFDGLFSAIKNLGSGNYGAARVRFGTGIYKTTAVSTDVRGVTFVGSGRFSTRISAKSASQAHIFQFTSANAAFVGERLEIIGWLPTASTSDYPTYGLRFDGGTNELVNIEINNCATGFWMGVGNDCRVSNVKVGEFTVAGGKFGGVDNGGTAAISENRINNCKFYSGSAYRGVGVLFGTDCGATVMENVDCGSCEVAFKIIDDLATGDNSRALGFLTLSNCTGGNCQIGLHVVNNGGNIKINDSVFSGLHATEGDGIRVESTNACIESRGTIFQNCTRAGIYVTAAWSVTVLGGTFRRVGIGGGTNGKGIWFYSGSAKGYILGNVFDTDLQVDVSSIMDYAVYLQSGFSGTVYAIGNRSIAMAIANYQNDSSSGGVLSVLSDNVISGSFTTPALKITQTGSGDSFLVQDSTSTDSTPFVIDNAGRVVVGDTEYRTFQSTLIPRLQSNATGADATAWGISNWATSGSTAGSVLLAKSRGNTVGTHTVVSSGDVVGTLGWAGSDGTAFIPAASIRAEVDGTPDKNDMPGKLVFATTLDGAAAVTDRWQIDNTGLLSAASGGSFAMPSLTWANIPAAGTVGKTVYVTNAGTKGSLWVDDGTRWKPMNGTVTLATLDTASSNIGTSETIVFQYLIPANLLQTYDRLRLWVNVLKSGTTDTGTIRVRVGTAGTTGDTAVTDYALMTAAHRSSSPIFEYRLESATSLQMVGNNASGNITRSWGTAGTTGSTGATAITSAAANALYVSVSILSSGATDTVSVQNAQLQLISSAN